MLLLTDTENEARAHQHRNNNTTRNDWTNTENVQFRLKMAANKSDTDTDLTKNGESWHFYLWTEEGIWVMCRDEMISRDCVFRPSLRHVGGAHRVCRTLEYCICWRTWRMLACFGMLTAVWRSHDPQTKAKGKGDTNQTITIHTSHKTPKELLSLVF